MMIREVKLLKYKKHYIGFRKRVSNKSSSESVTFFAFCHIRISQISRFLQYKIEVIVIGQMIVLKNT